MSDTSAELAALKAQLAAVMTAIEGKGVELSLPSIWVVHNPHKRAVWCSKTDCQMLGRKTTYDVVKENTDPEAEDIIMTGVSKEASDEEEDLLDKAWGLEANSRLSCQVRPKSELTVIKIPKYTINQVSEVP